ncbi:MAG: hypothetical protein LBE79_08265, partial [Tannerella sp.]|nr:hypothetical protein [Tannerella sp.]
MKFKIGDKVKYDSGDWWFYGAVSAVFEHPICPCYRLDIERMEKKDCKLSITQFEFELEAETILEREMDIPKLESAEIDHLKKDDKVRNYGHLSTLLERNLQALERMYQPVKSEPIPVRIDRPVPEGIQETITEPEKVNLLQKPTEKPLTRKAGEAWERCFDNFRKGVKSHSVNTWVYQNRR